MFPSHQFISGLSPPLWVQGHSLVLEKPKQGGGIAAVTAVSSVILMLYLRLSR